MINIRIAHFHLAATEPSKTIGFRATYTAIAQNPALQALLSFDDWLLDIVQVAEPIQTVTYYSLYNSKGEPITSVDAFHRVNRQGQRNFVDPNQIQQRGPPGPPFTLDVNKHILYRNSITTSHNFTLNEIFVSNLTD